MKLCFAATWSLVLGLAVVGPLQAGAGVKYAILIGCSEYDKAQLKPLPQTINDVEGFKKALLATGFDKEHVVVLHDKAAENRYRPFKVNIMQEINLLLDGLRPQDTIVVALSGHGLHFKGDATGYFCPLDTRVDDKKSLIPMDGKGGLFEILKNCPARQKLLIVIACRNDPANDIALSSNRLILDDEDKDDVPEGIAAIYSCRQGQKSYYDPDRKLSLFYDHLIRAWQGEYSKGAKVKLEDVLDQVCVKTKADANKTLRVAQAPEVRREYRGEWIIAEGGTGWTPLFNGKDLTGWITEAPKGNSTWKVVDGILTCEGFGSHLCTERGDFSDFHLRAEVKLNAAGNSGIYFRASQPLKFIGDYEAQLTNDPTQAYRTGSLQDLVKVTDRIVADDVWFTCEIIAQGERIQILINGKQTADYTESRPNRRTKGHFALQHINSKTQVQFRRIDIKDLSR